MKICPECGRNYADDAVVCAYDGTPLSSGSTVGWERPAVSEPQAGDVLGVYRVLAKLGEGGMGVIYRAEHVRLGRQVVLKVLKPELARRTELVGRFFGEARAVNEIGHPNIVDIIDFVEVSDQDPPLVYMVMELLKGQDLAARIRSAGPLEPEEAVEIACQVAEALTAVHRVKILHRDLKPENIFLVESEEGRKVKLLDFGVAKAFGERQKVSLTDPGTAVGTPEYMAPEQILGKELDERTDIYALGLVLYDMLTNSVPFESSKYGELLVMQVREPPEPPSARRSEGAPVPPALEAVVMRCLRKKPPDRFQNARELKEALRAAMGWEEGAAPRPIGGVSGPVVAVPGDDEPIRPARTRIPWLAVAAGLAALLGGFATVWLLVGKPPPSPAAATLEHRDARGASAAVGQTDGSAPAADSGPVAATRPAGPVDADSGPAARPELVRRKRPPRRGRGEKRHEKTKTGDPTAEKQPGQPPGKKRPKAGIEGTLDPFSQ